MSSEKTNAAPTARERQLYVVATSHLDTQWRWTFKETIQRFIPLTLHDNFALFEKFPGYTFSFEGAFRYMLVKEYFPEDFETLKGYVADGRWHFCGSAVDAGDVNTVSPESLMRQFLYGNGFTQREFGVKSRDVFLPDCFGFGWALPSVAAHCGLLGFSTSKLEWGSSAGIPFNVGVWEGPDGSSLVATINPGQYAFPLKEDDLANDSKWIGRIDTVGDACGAYVDFKYFGLGDTGGAPDEESVAKLERAMAADGAIRVLSAPADQLCRDLTAEQKERLPRHRGELLLIEHGVGTYTSHAELKRWNRRNELVADAAERVSVLADWLGAVPYPREMLRDAWVRFLANQMHDILPGTSIPEAYRLTWNDELLSFNQFESALSHGFFAAASQLNTQVDGTPVVVYNPASTDREDLVTVELPAPSGVLQAVSPDGKVGCVQVLGSQGGTARIAFPAVLPASSLAVYTISPAVEEPYSVLSVSDRRLENHRYIVDLNADGDIASIRDKVLNRELLTAAIHLEFLPHSPKEWPAWTLEYKDVSAPPIDRVAGPAEFRVMESGPARVAVEVRRKARGSVFVQRISLAAGDAGDRVEVENDVIWSTKGTILKARFPLAPANPRATYDLGLGTITRGNNHNRLYEVPAQQWADLTTPDGLWGVSILSESKYGWDKPDDGTLRLTLLHTPAMTGFECHLGGANYIDRFPEQDALDFGVHRFSFAIAGHEGDWRAMRAVAERFNQPMIASVCTTHPGRLGRRLSLASTSTAQVSVRAVKLAEESGEVIVRLQEESGRVVKGAKITLFAPIESAREVNGMEEPFGEATVKDGSLVVDFSPYRPRTFALKLASDISVTARPEFHQLPLPFNMDAISTNRNRQDGDIDGAGHTLPAELLPETIEFGGVPLKIGPKGYRERNAVVCGGQCVDFPADPYDVLFLLMASVGGDAEGTFEIDDRRIVLSVSDYNAPIGQWYDRIRHGTYTDAIEKMAPPFRKRCEVAWTASHRHSASSNADEAYERCNLYHFALALPPGARRLTLPRNDRIRVFSATLGRGGFLCTKRIDLTSWMM